MTNKESIFRDDIREDVIDACEDAAIAVIEKCREDGETDLRSVRARLQDAFGLVRDSWGLK